MKKSFVLALLSALSLAACGGGGSSSSVPSVVYPMSGVYAGPISNSFGSSGQMAIAITTNGGQAYGDYVVQFNGGTEEIVNFSQANTQVSGNNVTISGTLNAPGTSLACGITLTASMVNANEFKGNYVAGDGQADCGGITRTTVNFDLTRQQLQDAQKQLKSLHAAGSN